jgi:hypothetical protein
MGLVVQPNQKLFWVMLGQDSTLIGNARARPDADGSCWGQDLMLMGPAEAKPKAILDLTRDRTQL